MLTRARTWYASLPDPVKAAGAMFVLAFVGIFGPALLGWLTELATWVADVGAGAPDARPFPDPSVLSKALFAALSAGFLALVNYVFRAAQQRFSWIPGSGPKYPDAIEVTATTGTSIPVLGRPPS